MKEEINTMPKTSLYNMEGAAIGEVELSEEIFASPINTAAMHLVVRSILANMRQGTQSALTRGEVRGGGRKIYRQKGTGNARHHGNRAPQFKHGGVVFAPKPRDYVINVPKKVRRLAFKSAMTSKLNAGDIIVVDQFTLAEPKTKLAAAALAKFDLAKKNMLVLPGRDENVVRATGNIAGLQTSYVNTLNVYDILKAGKIILTQDALKGVEEVYA
jgi:large subunit ribosomal protein L4